MRNIVISGVKTNHLGPTREREVEHTVISGAIPDHLVPTLRVGMHRLRSCPNFQYAFPRGAWERDAKHSNFWSEDEPPRFYAPCSAEEAHRSALRRYDVGSSRLARCSPFRPVSSVLF